MGIKDRLQEAAVRLANAQRELADAQAEFDRIFTIVRRGRDNGAKSKTTPASSGLAGLFDPEADASIERTSVTSRVMGFLTDNRGKFFTTAEIADQVRASQGNTRTALHRFFKPGRVSRDDDGRWGVPL